MADFLCGSYCVRILQLLIPNVVTLLRWGWFPGFPVKFRFGFSKSSISWWPCSVKSHRRHRMRLLLWASGQESLQAGPSWDMIRDALIRGVTIGGNICPTEEVGCLIVSFLERLPLPRLVHFLDMIFPQMVPVQSPCHSRRRRFASSYRVEERLARGDPVVEYLHVCKLNW